MRPIARIVLTILCLAIMPSIAHAEPVPDEAATRQGIDGLIKSFQDSHKKATLGLLQESAARSISFGAPAWNEGDHSACCRFYLKTVESLCEAFPADNDHATEPAAAMLKVLAVARDRAHQSNDIDRNAWSLRFAFDTIQMNSSIETARVEQEVRLGSEALLHGSYPEAEDAFGAAVAALNEFDGMSVDSLPGIVCYAPMALSNALFAQGKYKESAEMISRGLVYLPAWPLEKYDPRRMFGDPAVHRLMLRDLEQKASQQPEEASVQFLLGYHYYFTDDRARATEQFNKTLKLDPSNSAAKIFLHPPTEKSKHPRQPSV